MKKIIILLILILCAFNVHADLTDGLTNYWSFDSDLTDDQGTADFTNQGTTSATGKLGNARSFNRTNTEYMTNTDGSVLAGSNAKSVSFWVYFNNLPDGGTVNEHTMFGHYGTGTNGGKYEIIYENNSGVYEIAFRVGSGYRLWNVGDITGGWKHIVLTLPTSPNTNNAILYVDNVAKTAGTTSARAINTENSAWDFGRNEQNTNRYMDGLIDEIAIYNKTLNSSEVSELYNSGTGYNPLATIYSSCFQESPTTSNQTGNDNECGLFYNGTIDKTTTARYMAVNYTKPDHSVGAIWQTRHGNLSTYNTTIPEDCWNQSEQVLRLRMYSNGDAGLRSYGECYNGTGWELVTQDADSSGSNFQNTNSDGSNMHDGAYNTYSCYSTNAYGGHPEGWYNNCGNDAHGRVYEEAVYWNISSENTAPTVNILNSTGDTYNTQPQISFNYTDAEDTTADCDLYFNDISRASNTAVENNTNTILQPSSALDYGSYSVRVGCYDGQVTSYSSTITINITEAPGTWSPEHRLQEWINGSTSTVVGYIDRSGNLYLKDDINVTGNIYVGGCIKYNGGTLGTCI